MFVGENLRKKNSRWDDNELKTRANELSMCMIDPKNHTSFVACERVALEGD